MKKIAIKEKIAVGLVLAMLVTNPLTGQYLMQAVDWAFSQIFAYGAWVSLAATVYLIGLGVYYYIRSERIKIPPKPKQIVVR